MLEIAPKHTIKIPSSLNCQIWSSISANMASAIDSTMRLAAYVNPFLNEMSRSLFYVLYVIELTMAMFEICTNAQPTLNIAGRMT